MALCPRCHRQNPEAATLCGACGTPLAPHTLMAPSASLVKRPKVVLRVVRADGGAETSYPMSGDVLSCGRTADIKLPDDPFVAALQARFFFSGARLALEDVGGGNGVFVRLRGEREVSTGGELRVGRQRLILEPIPALAPAPGGGMAWGSPDPGYKLRLVQLLEGGGKGAAFPLKDGDNFLGREQGDLSFPTDGFVSGRHAVLQVQGERLMVRDLGSSNGTFVRLSAPSFVENGDQFLVGRELVRVDLSGQP